MKLGQKIKKAREDSDLTLDELSSIFNKKYGFATNKGMISKWENGITTPSLQFIQAYAKEFNVDLNYLLDTGIGLTIHNHYCNISNYFNAYI